MSKASTRFIVLASVLSIDLCGTALAARMSDIRNTRHNLSANGPGTVKAVAENQVCVFCHTPHGATPNEGPLWNRTLPATTYTPYTSTSLDALSLQGTLNPPGGSSRLCMSCHDGSIAVGNVNVTGGVSPVSIPMNGTGAAGVMPDGAGASTGYTRKLGADLTNDHPISATYTGSGGIVGTNTLADRDGELRDVDASQKFPASGTPWIGVRAVGQRPVLPLEPTEPTTNLGQVQCASCHDPHIRESSSSAVDYGKEKFLRLPRFQPTQPTSQSYASDIICRVCHNKDRDGGTYAYSAHANSAVATQTYSTAATTARDFPVGLPVWKASCLNCHDPHTVAGSRRLLREGTDNVLVPKAGGSPAIEETCYQCHDGTGTVVGATGVPNIKTDFALARRMPIKSGDQPGGSEKHNIGDLGGDSCALATGAVADQRGNYEGCGKDLVESRIQLGYNTAANRHAECPDCHNPHRVMRLRLFYSRQSAGKAGDWSTTIGAIEGGGLATPDAEGTHLHYNNSGYTHTNIISGVLRGTFGVEPQYANNSFHALPSGYTVKRGDPGTSTSTLVTENFVTREYQICLKCHSDYAYADDNAYPTGTTRPRLDSFTGGTPTTTNGLVAYTNQAKEFNSPTTHQGEVSTTDGGAKTGVGYYPDGTTLRWDFSTNNHRSWHPVMISTLRDATTRKASASNWKSPFDNAVGSQTMYCTDCHGSATATGTVIPNGTAPNGNPWGPHGSENNFILKGTWTGDTGSGEQATGICFKCHDYTNYATKDGSGSSGFGGSKSGNLHGYHADKVGKLRCSWCHVAVPHGWKNKAFLVNLNDVGPEAGLAAGTQLRNGATGAVNRPPYYNNAINKIVFFAASGNWKDTDCGSKGAPGNGKVGRDWMRDSTENCANPP